MKNQNSKNRTLKLLTSITAVVLLGITSLQVYWLVASYNDQKSRFTADIENAIFATVVKIQINKTMENTPSTGLDSTRKQGLSELVSSALNKIPKEVLFDKERSQKSFAIEINDTSVESTIDPSELSDLLQKSNHTSVAFSVTVETDTNSTIDISKAELLTYKKIFQKELDKRVIKVPFELALVDSFNQIYIATCDTVAFHKIKIKSNAGLFGNQMSFGKYSLQAAFPDANLFLIKRMAWILVVTFILIILGFCSLSYLLFLFFQQKKIADIRNDFMNNMTHELKTPISSVAVALEMVLDQRHEMVEEKKKEYLKIAQSELRRLNILVESVLKISSFERGVIRINKETIVAMPWLLELKSNLSPVLEHRNATLNIKVYPELLSFNADKTHLSNVLHNLIENGLKYNDKNEPIISVALTEEGENISFTVADNGMGIDSKYIDKIFDKFFRIPNGDRHDVKGYGLGLSYVKAVVELHDGSLSVQSRPGEGSTFTLILPSKK